MTTHTARPLLGLRRTPGRLALHVFRSPLVLYHHGLGRFLGHAFLLVAHEGRRSRRRYEMVAMVLAHDEETSEVVICSGWGPDTDWLRNLHAHPALAIEIGRRMFKPQQRFLDEDEAVEVARAFVQRHPHRVRLISRILDWGRLDTEGGVRAFVRTHPFVAFTPRAS